MRAAAAWAVLLRTRTLRGVLKRRRFRVAASGWIEAATCETNLKGCILREHPRTAEPLHSKERAGLKLSRILREGPSPRWRREVPPARAKGAFAHGQRADPDDRGTGTGTPTPTPTESATLAAHFPWAICRGRRRGCETKKESSLEFVRTLIFNLIAGHSRR